MTRTKLTYFKHVACIPHTRRFIACQISKKKLPILNTRQQSVRWQLEPVLSNLRPLFLNPALVFGLQPQFCSHIQVTELLIILIKKMLS